MLAQVVTLKTNKEKCGFLASFGVPLDTIHKKSTTLQKDTSHPYRHRTPKQRRREQRLVRSRLHPRRVDGSDSPHLVSNTSVTARDAR